jgi:5-methylcytosine-specific restriction endonuclease McrA
MKRIMHEKIEIKCETCGKAFFRYVSNLRINQHIFCSHKCQGIFSTGRKLFIRKKKIQKMLFLISCAYCQNPVYKWNFQIKKNKRHFCSSECHGKWNSIYKTEENAVNWKGGLNYSAHKILTNPRYIKIRKQVLQRDNYSCALCKSDIKLEVHHIIEKSKNILFAFDSNNMISLCRKCHIGIRGNEEGYIGLFNDIVEKRVNSGKPLLNSEAIPSQASDKSEGACRDYVLSPKGMI